MEWLPTVYRAPINLPENPILRALRHFLALQSFGLSLSLAATAMAVSLQSFATLGNPIPNPSLWGSRAPQAFCRLSFSPFLHLEAVPPRGLGLSQPFLSKRNPGFRLIAVERRVSRLVPFAASHEESVSRSWEFAAVSGACFVLFDPDFHAMFFPIDAIDVGSFESGCSPLFKVDTVLLLLFSGCRS